MKKIITFLSCMLFSVAAYCAVNSESNGDYRSSTNPDRSIYSDTEYDSTYRSNKYGTPDRTTNRNSSSYLYNNESNTNALDTDSREHLDYEDKSSSSYPYNQTTPNTYSSPYDSSMPSGMNSTSTGTRTK